jgi:hypothetical protein
MTLVDTPTVQAKEEWLKFRAQPISGQGQDVAVVSGSAGYYQDQLIGDPDSDITKVYYEVRLWVGPAWRKLNDVSPMAYVAGFAHLDSDTADMTGWEIENCQWEFPDPNPTKQIRLIIHLNQRGGNLASLTRIGYHLTPGVR